MKSMTLTGLGSEQDFETGEAGYFLIFNGGDLRVPISEKAAEIVLKEIYGKKDATPEAASESESEQPFYQDDSSTETSDSEDGVDQV